MAILCDRAELVEVQERRCLDLREEVEAFECPSNQHAALTPPSMPRLAACYRAWLVCFTAGLNFDNVRSMTVKPVRRTGRSWL